jgi:pimeloyl-ACP methyl ester carboxylesterase
MSTDDTAGSTLDVSDDERGDTTTPSTAAATRGFAGSQLKAPVPDGVERELLALVSEDGAWHNAAVYRPVGARPRHGVVLMHPAADFMQHYALGPFAQMGFAALGVNPRFAAESDAIMEQCVLDLASGVAYLRAQGCETVALLGNSGGGGLTAFYQSQAEQPSVTATPAGDPPDLTAADLPAADAVILLNAHRGRPQVLTSYLDPSVVDEDDPLATDPSLDMFDPRNGPPYAPAFVERYRAAQVARNDRITSWAQERLVAIASLGYRDEAFLVYRTVAALEMLDPALDPSDRPLGWYGGPDVQYQNRAGSSLARFNTLRSWLSQFGLSTSNALSGPNLARVSVPVLVVQGTADEGIFPADARALHEAAGSDDKALRWIDGGRHFFAGQPELQQQTLGLIADWLALRGLGPARTI